MPKPNTTPSPMAAEMRLRLALSRFPLALKRDMPLVSLLRRADDPSGGETGEGPEIETPNLLAGGILVMPIRGLIAPRWEDIGDCCCVATLMDQFMIACDQAKADPNIRGVVLDISSPGGIVWLVPEAAKKLRELALVKPVRGVANAQAASAAYYLLAACGKRYVTRSGEAGSVGVWTMHVDESKMLADWGITVKLIFEGEHKVDGNPFEPLPADVEAQMQKNVKTSYDMFTGDVANYMGVSVEKVLADFGQGRCVMAEEALAAGMVDGIATLDEVITMLQGEIQAADAAAAVAEAAAMVAGGTLTAEGEPRSDGLVGVEVRSAEGVRLDGSRIIGKGVPYGSPSQDLGGLREVFEAGAFASSIVADDVKVIWQHKAECVLGRVRAGTASVTEQADGIHYTATPPDAQWARDAVESIRRGDVNQNSFGFRVAEPRKSYERFERRSDGIVYRVISRATLVELGPQTHPAYTDTSVALRSMQAALAAGEIIDMPTPPTPSVASSLDSLRDRMKAVEASL